MSVSSVCVLTAVLWAEMGGHGAERMEFALGLHDLDGPSTADPFAAVFLGNDGDPIDFTSADVAYTDAYALPPALAPRRRGPRR